MKNTELRNRILACLSSGGLTTPELAAQLHQSIKVIGRACGAMTKDHELTHSGRYKRYRWHLSGTAPPEVILRRTITPPPIPSLKTAPRIPVGINESDLAWMEHYRQQAAMRLNRRGVRA